MVDTLPTVQSLKFTTLGRNSLLNRISGPTSLPTSVNFGERVDDLEDSYVDMDVDDAAPEPPEPESGRTQPALLSRLGRRIDSPSPLSIPIFFRPDGTYTPPAIAGVFLPALTGSATSPQHAIQTMDVSSPGSSIPIAQPAFEVMMDVVTQNNGDSYVDHTSHAITSGAIVLESVASSSNFGSITSPLHIPASRTVRQTNDVTMPRVEPLSSPPQRTGSPRFVFKPLSELLQEERDAWSEVFEKKQARQAQVPSGTAGIQEPSHQASFSMLASAPAQTALRATNNDCKLPAMSSVPTTSAIIAQRAEVPAESNVDRNSQESVPSLPMFTHSRMLFDAIQNSTPGHQTVGEQIRSASTTISATLYDRGIVAEGSPSPESRHQATPGVVAHFSDPRNSSRQFKLPRSSVHKVRDHSPTISSTEGCSAPPSTGPIDRTFSAPNDIFLNALHAPRGDDNVTPGKRKPSPSPLSAPDGDDIHQAKKRRRTIMDAPSYKITDTVSWSMQPQASAPDQLFRTLSTEPTSRVDSLPHGPASTATGSSSTPTTDEKRRKTRNQLTLAKAHETGDFSTIVALLPPSAQVKEEEEEDSKARVKLEEDSKIDIKKEDEDGDEKPFATTSTSSNIPLKAPKNEEGDPSFNDKEGSPTLHSAEGLAEPVSGGLGHSGNSRGETSSESPGGTPRQADIQPRDGHLQGDRNQQRQLGTPVHEETETRESDHRHVSHVVSNGPIPHSDVDHAVHVSQGAEYHKTANTQRGLERLETRSATVTATQNQANAPGELQASMTSPQQQTGQTDHLTVPVSRATSESTASMSISPSATPAPRSTEIDVQPAVTFDYDSQTNKHATVRYHRSPSNEVQHRRFLPERPVRSHDHWSPTPSPAPSPRPRYQPRSPSPERIGPRLLDSYRPAYGRNRTPPRFSRRGLGGMLGSPTHSGSLIRREPRPEVTRLGPRPSLRESADGEGPVATCSGNARADTPPRPRSRPPTSIQQPSAEPKHMMPSPSSCVAIVNANFDDDDQRMDHEKNAKDDSHEHQLISDRQPGADPKPIREALPNQPLVAPVSAASTVTEREAPPRPTSSPLFLQNSVLHSNAGPPMVPNRKVVASNVAQTDNGADRIINKPAAPLAVPLSPGTHQHAEDPPRKSTVSLTNFSANYAESQCYLRHDGHARDLNGNNNAGAARARETQPQEKGRIEYSRTGPRLERGGRETQHERVFAPDVSENSLLARISREKLDSATSNENNGDEAMSADTCTECSDLNPLNPRPLPELKDRVGATYATENATRRLDSDASALLANRIGIALNISESDALPAERSVVMPLPMRISGAPSRSQRPAHLLPPKPSVSYNEDGSERSDKRVWLSRPQATNGPALLGRISSNGKVNGSQRPPQNNSFVTRSNISGQEQIHHTSPNVTQAKKRPLEKRLS